MQTPPYTTANFTVSATNATVNITPPNGGAAAPQATVTPGGILEIDANSIGVSGVIQTASATLTLNGTTGVALGSSAQVLDGGSIQQLKVNGHMTAVGNPGGSIYLNSASGPVNIEAGALVDVSGVQEDNFAYAQTNKINYNIFTDPNDIGVNAGLISIYSPNAPVTLKGTLKGDAGYWKSYDGSSVANGTGGSFVLDTENLSQISTPDGSKTGFSGLNAMLASGEFNDSLDIRSRTDSSLTVAATDTVVARQFELTADQGSIYVIGKIQASDPNGDSSVELYAGKDLILYNGSAISATGSQSSAHGGEIVLSSTEGH
jgi:filamentous hemagglutinin